MPGEDRAPGDPHGPRREGPNEPITDFLGEHIVAELEDRDGSHITLVAQPSRPAHYDPNANPSDARPAQYPPSMLTSTFSPEIRWPAHIMRDLELARRYRGDLLFAEYEEQQELFRVRREQEQAAREEQARQQALERQNSVLTSAVGDVRQHWSSQPRASQLPVQEAEPSELPDQTQRSPPGPAGRHVRQ